MTTIKKLLLFLPLLMLVGCEKNFDPAAWNGVRLAGYYEGQMVILVDGYNLVTNQAETSSSLPIGFTVTQDETLKFSIQYDSYYSYEGEDYVVNMQSTINDIEVAADATNTDRVILSATSPSASCVITEEVCVISSVTGYINDAGYLRVEISAVTNSGVPPENEVTIILSASRS